MRAANKLPLTLAEAEKKFGWEPPGSIILSREILLGEACNARCLFCCAKAMTGSVSWLPYRAALAELEKARRDGVWLVTFSGGEATLYPRLPALMSRARAMGFPVIQLLSNGFKLADYTFAETLVKAGLNEIKISLHSTTPATHDTIMGVKGSFALALKAIENLNRLGVKVSTNFAVTALNYRQLPLFVRLMERWGLSGFCFMFSFYEGGMLENSGRLNVSYAAALPYLKLALRYMAARGMKPESKMLSNFTPCLAPEYANLMADYGEAGPEEISKSGKGAGIAAFHSARKARPAACSGCALGKSCAGPDRGYLEIYGPAEFSPLKKKPSRFILKPTYP